MERFSHKDLEGMLYNYKVLKATNSSRKMELEDIETGVCSPSLDQAGKTLSLQSKVERSVINNLEDRDKIKADYEKDNKKIKLLENALFSLTSQELEVIEARYFEKRQWWEVASAMNFSDIRCKQIRREAINKMLIVINL